MPHYTDTPLVIGAADLHDASLNYLNDAKAVACWLDEQPVYVQDRFKKTLEKHLAFINSTNEKIEKASENLRKIDDYFRRLEH